MGIFQAGLSSSYLAFVIALMIYVQMDGRWTQIGHGLMIAEEIEKFNTHITEVGTLFKVACGHSLEYLNC
jgi:hypothetical protein